MDLLQQKADHRNYELMQKTESGENTKTQVTALKKCQAC